MHFFTKILHVCVVLHVAFHGAAGAILRGRAGDTDPGQAGGLQLITPDVGLTNDLESLDKQLTSLFKTLNGGQPTPVIADAVKAAKRQTVQISEQTLRDLLNLIQSIATQITSLIDTSAGGTSVAAPPDTTSTPGPVASPIPVVPSSPVQSANPPATNPPAATGGDSNVGPVVPIPFLTSSSAGNPITTAYGTATLTGTRCKTTLTQTYTAYVYEDGTSAVARQVRSVDTDDDEDSDELDLDELDEDSSTVIQREPWADADGSTTGDGVVDLDQREAEAWTAFTPRPFWIDFARWMKLQTRRRLMAHDGRHGMWGNDLDDSHDRHDIPLVRND
ncbi:hypothetical protein Cob_v000221 [Colletotrichum orbiculare MAFF 240422]|uniref:Cell wall protein n=1 Tax=Colletotrichum orbiculare (strain 104-T / ATCC 96160 / CBS 514.97 / LARS 414 / MAFF 240422) TaxID=1213857 RepID=A0A484G6R7_COLOR|nr:hypothetical protein Cob_v000221 [Colletotrichum orbiculare MAFF 240422]